MTKSRLTKNKEKIIVDLITKFYDRRLKLVSRYANMNNTGGKIRQAMGDLGEDLSALVWLEIAKLYKDLEKPIKPKKGESDQIKCVNESGNTFYAHVDKHCYIDGKFVLAIESKSYLDSCYYYRASNDFRLLKQYHDTNLICIVVSIEDAAKEESKKFIEDERWVNKTFVLTDGKRSSAKPIWRKEFRKELNIKRVQALIEYIDGIFRHSIPIK